MAHRGRKVLVKLYKGETIDVDYIVQGMGKLNHVNINLAEPWKLHSDLWQCSDINNMKVKLSL